MTESKPLCVEEAAYWGLSPPGSSTAAITISSSVLFKHHQIVPEWAILIPDFIKWQKKTCWESKHRHID